jgi:hypothetical protein
MLRPNLLVFLICLLLIALLNSCTKEEDTIYEENQETLNALTRGHAVQNMVYKSSKKVVSDITLLPSGDMTGVTDATAIENAFASLPADGVVLFETGDFYLNREIVTTNFSGTILGSGNNETHIIGVVDGATPFISNTLFNFRHPAGDLAIKNLSFLLSDGFKTDTEHSFGGFNLFSYISVGLTPTGSNTYFEDLHMTGTETVAGSNPIIEFQPLEGVYVVGDQSEIPILSSGGNHLLTKCKFHKIGIQATLYERMKNATIQVSNNVYTEVKQTIFRILDGCQVKITRNYLETFAFGAIVITQEGFAIDGENSEVEISQNEVITQGYMPIEVGDIPAGFAGFNLLIEKNKLTNLGPFGDVFGNCAVIGIFPGTDGAIVKNNIIRGEASFGILAATNGSTFKSNNLQVFTGYQTDYGIYGLSNNLIGTGNSSITQGESDEFPGCF